MKNGYHRGLEIVDAAGLHYRVKDAVKVETLVRSWRTELFLNPIVRVALEMEGEGRPIPLDRVKQLVLKAFAAHLIFWDAAGNLDELRELVRSAESVHDVMAALRDEANA